VSDEEKSLSKHCRKLGKQHLEDFFRWLQKTVSDSANVTWHGIYKSITTTMPIQKHYFLDNQR